ncbi:non-ribosomal peptide synthetase [Streptomyces sp. NPDC006863]|uniref:non-ribosomal peptide synthetase n=1 Tax=Streptomyces sp. NPDC006863 TaxID=3154779 RepID=UPI0033F58BAA
MSSPSAADHGRPPAGGRNEEFRQGTDEALAMTDRRAPLDLGTGDPLPETGRTAVPAQVAALAAAAPGRAAVVCGEDRIGRGELDAWAGRIAARLASAGITAGERVGILADRSTAMVAAALGAMRAGAAYVPVDPANPDERIAAVLTDARVAAVLVTGDTAHRVPRDSPRVLRVDGADVRDHGDVMPPAPAAPQDAAYLIYTSGSTGAPKGVVVEHQQLSASTLARREVYPGEPVFLLLSPLSFDSSVAGLWGTLTAGGLLVVAGPDEYRDPRALLGLVERHGVTHLLGVPSLYDALLAAAEQDGRPRLASLTTVVTAGEPLPEALVRRHFRTFGSGTALVNEYGPTEATVWSSYRRFEEPGPVDIGGPVPGVRLYVLDEAGRPVPRGTTGELYIGGAGVARGYFDRPEATARVFTPDPFAEATASGASPRMYRTGDMVRWSASGGLEFLGRRDNQVKIRGHRVELGAVEAALRSCQGIRDAVAVVDAAGSRLTGFVVTDAPDALPAVRESLARVLPEAAVPARLRALDSFPLTVNGKADRAALAALPDPAAPAAAAANPGPAAPGGPAGVEPAPARKAPVADPVAQVSAAWAEVLEIATVPADVNFFDLGGHSLLIIRLQEALGRHAGVQPSVVELFRRTTVTSQAELVREGATAGTGPATPDTGRAQRARQERAARARRRRVEQGAA